MDETVVPRKFLLLLAAGIESEQAKQSGHHSGMVSSRKYVTLPSTLGANGSVQISIVMACLIVLNKNA